MRKFRLISKKFTGEIIIAYSATGTLKLVDATDTKFNAKTMAKLFEMLPMLLGDDLNATLGKLSAEKQIKITEIPADLSFDRFWNTYDKKINKKRCIPLYKKLNDADKFLAIIHVKDYNNYLSWQSWRSKMDPEKWLRDRQYETEWKKLKN